MACIRDPVDACLYKMAFSIKGPGHYIQHLSNLNLSPSFASLYALVPERARLTNAAMQNTCGGYNPLSPLASEADQGAFSLVRWSEVAPEPPHWLCQQCTLQSLAHEASHPCRALAEPMPQPGSP